MNEKEKGGETRHLKRRKTTVENCTPPLQSLGGMAGAGGRKKAKTMKTEEVAGLAIAP